MFFDEDAIRQAVEEAEDMLPALAYAVGIVGALWLGYWLAA